MTWQGGKRPREVGPLLPFARLKPLAQEQDDPAKGLEKLAKALSSYRSPVRLHVRLVTGNDGARVEHWEVQGGSKNAKAQRKEPKAADVILVMRPETWAQIAQGQLAPYEALYSGKLRVRGNLELAKAITEHLSDPASPYVAPC
jgi:putative sterol carrier protein